MAFFTDFREVPEQTLSIIPFRKDALSEIVSRAALRSEQRTYLSRDYDGVKPQEGGLKRFRLRVDPGQDFRAYTFLRRP